jgi:hypothetical protein
MKKLFFVILSFSLCSTAQIQKSADNYPGGIITVPGEYQSKIGSGDLIKVISERLCKPKTASKVSGIQPVEVVIYQRDYPSMEQVSHFKNLGVKCYLDSWTPPFGEHPFGFFIAELPSDKLLEVLADVNIKKIETAEALSMPFDNEAARKIKANLVWNSGIKGGGIKLAILDSGLDTDPTNPDFNNTITKKDYSNYPTLDDDIENHAISHGTQIAASALGSGYLSENNIGNGSGAYEGIASEASLVFLKIGNDINGLAKTSAILNALDAAVNIYGARVVSLSYGSWDIYHDGSGTQDQKVDWCYSQGVPVFLAAGNDGNTGRHYSGTVNALDSSGYIKINVSNALENSTYLAFNTVWYDGLGIHNNLTLKYYNSSYQEILNVYNYPQTESNKGTESKISQTLTAVPTGNSVYYLKIINYSSAVQQYHIYEHFKDGKVTFDKPDPNYTLASPSTATYGFSVGAFTSRQSWTAYDGLIYSFGENVDQLSSFSSRGPRIDGLQKPDLVAPGSGIISLRDRDVQTSSDMYWIDNDGIIGGEANYYIVQGTSFAAPIAAGAAILLINRFPNITADELLNALRNNTTKDEYTGSTPNSAYGYGKLNIYSAVNDQELLSKYAIKLNTKVFLEGPYQNGSMNTLLNSNNFIPLSQPYNTAPWNYYGTESVSNIPEDIVDWVLIEIRTSVEASSVLGRRAGFLRNDGVVVDLDGTSPVSTTDIPEGEYYLVIKHRNHLAIMSSVLVSLGTVSSLYDFTISSTSAYGTDALKNLGDGKFGMWSGDANGNGTINSTDLNEYWMPENGTNFNYSTKPADFNLDGNINATDLNLQWLLNNGISTKVPN